MKFNAILSVLPMFLSTFAFAQSLSLAEKLDRISGRQYMLTQVSTGCGLSVLTDSTSMKLFITYTDPTKACPPNFVGKTTQISCSQTECSYGPERMKTKLTITPDLNIVSVTFDQLGNPQQTFVYAPYTNSECGQINGRSYCVGEQVLMSANLQGHPNYYHLITIKNFFQPVGSVLIYQHTSLSHPEQPQYDFQYQFYQNQAPLLKVIPCTTKAPRICTNDRVKTDGVQVEVLRVFENDLIEFQIGSKSNPRYVEPAYNFKPLN